MKRAGKLNYSWPEIPFSKFAISFKRQTSRVVMLLCTSLRDIKKRDSRNKHSPSPSRCFN
jgi:hypothetical protein